MKDRDLGMDRPITRRDFLNGVAVTSAGLLLNRQALALGWQDASTAAGAAYPPGLTGLRGSHDGSWETAHALRDGGFWDAAGEPRDTGEEYDLVVVGAGISGLAAAHYFRENVGQKARILILDNHDDFGGHAKRNEFSVDGRLLLSYGGTFAIESAGPYSSLSDALLRTLGVDVSAWERVSDRELYARHGMGAGVFFDRETFGSDRLLRAPRGRRGQRDVEEAVDPAAWRAFLAEAPIVEAAKQDLLRLVTDPADYLPGVSSDDKKARLARMSYADYLTRHAGCHADVVKFLQARPHGLFGVGIDAVPALDAWGLGLPGFEGLGLEAGPGPGQNLDSYPYPGGESYFFHFPDGNATLARLLVRDLVPPAVPGKTAEDVVLARCDYGRLDEAASPVRVRLSSTVVRVRHLGEPSTARQVEVVWSRGGRLERARGARCVLACWHQVIPLLCPELPAAQREALASATKVPLVYTSVAVRDWQPWVKAGVHQVHCPGAYYNGANLNIPVSLGGYEFPTRPDQPIPVHLGRAACQPGLDARRQHDAGRVELFTTSFEDYERATRDQLARMLGPSGFDPARDVAAITVNRWPHGYAYQYNSLVDGFWLENGETPCQRARRPFGLVAIANADAAAYSYTDASIDHAFRAVQEILPRRG